MHDFRRRRRQASDRKSNFVSRAGAVSLTFYSRHARGKRESSRHASLFREQPSDLGDRTVCAGLEFSRRAETASSACQRRFDCRWCLPWGRGLERFGIASPLNLRFERPAVVGGMGIISSSHLFFSSDLSFTSWSSRPAAGAPHFRTRRASPNVEQTAYRLVKFWPRWRKAFLCAG